MVNVTLSVPEEVKKMMDEYSEVKWSEVARKAIIQKLAMLRKLDEMSVSSTLTDADIEKMEHEIKRKVAKKHGM
ncbi:MAG: hypothetical protein Q7S22_03815 [Candidatus Micrarchaeota archaeon]|nr:hypothetical protein [Candidatus Micrarchaeota archaeon]